jgi:opacity protein-like surface antigen
MKTRHLLLAAVAFAVLALAPAAAHADPLVFTLNNAAQTGMVGQTLTFSATVSNPGTSGNNSLTLNGDDSSFPSPPSPQLTLDDTLYFTNFDGLVLNVGQSFTDNVFTVMIGAGALPGTYNGSFTLFYDGGQTGQTATQNFRVTVQGASSAVPEPATVLLFGAGLAGIAAKVRRRHKSDSTKA